MEIDQALHAVEMVYETVARPETWADALQAIADCVNSEGCALVTQHEGGQFSALVSPALVALQSDYDREWWKKDIITPRAIAHSFGPDGGYVSDRDLVTPDEIANHPFYSELRAKHGLGWCAGGIVSPYKNVVVAIALQRAKAKGEYRKDEVSLVSKLGAHVERALMLALRLEEQSQRAAALMDAIEKLSAGIILIDKLGRAAEMNLAARRLHGAGFTIRSGRLSFSSPTAQRAYDTVLLRLLKSPHLLSLEGEAPIAIPRPEPATPLIGYAVAISPHAHGFLAVTSAIAGALVIFDPRTAAPPQPALVRDFLNITLGEARVASAIGLGKSPRDVAAQLQISESTVRTALKRIFAKTGIARQSELAVIMNRLGLIRDPE